MIILLLPKLYSVKRKKMNRSIVFLLVIMAICFGLNETCQLNRVVISNQLGSNELLEFHCRNTTFVFPVNTLRNFNDEQTFEFADVKSKKRTRYECDLLSFGGATRYYFDKLEVYRAARKRRCGQLRQWAARHDGIYFRRDYNKPLGHVLNWKMEHQDDY